MFESFSKQFHKILTKVVYLVPKLRSKSNLLFLIPIQGIDGDQMYDANDKYLGKGQDPRSRKMFTNIETFSEIDHNCRRCFTKN